MMETSHDWWKIEALEHSGTWELTPFSKGNKSIGGRWVYAIKVGENGQIYHLKAQLVTKRYSKIYGFDYGDTFYHVEKITFVWLFIAIVVIRHWPLYQLDIKNMFIHGEL